MDTENPGIQKSLLTLEDVAETHAANAASAAGGEKPKRGRPTEKERAARAARAASAGGVPQTAPPRQLFTPTICRPLIELPFQAAGIFLKSEAWALDESETDLLAGPGAETLNQFFPETSPKWAALTAFSLALMTVVSKKYLQFKMEQSLKKENAGG